MSHRAALRRGQGAGSPGPVPAAFIVLGLGLIPLPLLVPACTSTSLRGGSGFRDKLSRVGLALVSERDAFVPPGETGRYIPCRVLTGAGNPQLPPHPAGYLLVGVVDGESGPDAIRAAVAEWKPGTFLRLRVRRNPWRDAESEWWEGNVRFRLPPD